MKKKKEEEGGEDRDGDAAADERMHRTDLLRLKEIVPAPRKRISSQTNRTWRKQFLKRKAT